MIRRVRGAAEGASRQPVLGAAGILRPPPAARLTAWLLGITLLGLWTWWALADGAFFGTVMLPGTLALSATLIIAGVYVPQPLSTRGPHVIGVAGLGLLAVWTTLSILWSPAQDQALENAQRGFLFAGVYVAGLALALALRRRLILSLVPLLGAGAIVTLVVVVRVLLADEVDGLVDAEGTLSFPFGYRNANACFFVVCAFASIPLLARARSGPLVRAAAAALAAAALAAAAISQSRGSLLGAIAAVVVLLLVAPTRGRALLALSIAAIPVAALFGELLGPYDAAANSQPVLPELQQAVVATVVAGVVAGLLGAAWAILEQRMPSGPQIPLPPRRATLIVGALTILAGAVVAVALAGSPTRWLDSGGSGNEVQAESSGSRYTYSGNLNRGDFWRVALLQARDSPLAGEGSGSYRSRYLLERDTAEAPRDAHSLPLEVLGELGIVGLALLGAGLLGVTGGALRSRRLGPEAATVSAAALAAGAAWFTQASVDWFWAFAGLTGPVLALLGSAAAPGALSFVPLGGGATRGGVAVAAIVGALAIPTYAADRLTVTAAQGWRSDVDGAYRALDAAADLNPLSDLPDLVKAEIARQNGDVPLAMASLEQARERQPDEFQNYLLGAELLRLADPTQALADAERALDLNPRSRQGRRLLEALQRDLGQGPADDSAGRPEP